LVTRLVAVPALGFLLLLLLGLCLLGFDATPAEFQILFLPARLRGLSRRRSGVGQALLHLLAFLPGGGARRNG